MRDRPTRSGDMPPHAPDEAQSAEDTPERTPDGRFASGHSGNPKGRPPKPNEDVASILQRIMAEELPREGGGTPKSVGETMIRQTMVHGMSHPQIALSLLKLCLAASVRQLEAKTEVDEDEQREAILADYVKRKSRPLGGPTPTTDDDDSEEPDEEDK